jgi:YVTN family beta-propeller protein
MDLHLLGPVEATHGEHPIPLGAAKQRAVLAMLALQANETVSVDRLVDGLWGEEPPATAPKMVQLYVSQLRRLLAGNGAEIVTHGRGYELSLPSDAVDALRFERLVERAGSYVGGSNDAAREALAMWRGPALADVAGEPFAAAEIRRLDELWLQASELVVEADLAAGRDQEALAQLERLIEDHQLRERLHGQRMLALYRSGRQAEALEAYADARQRLVDQAGVEPGAKLRELQAGILRQDPALDLPAAPVEPRPAGRTASAPSQTEASAPAVRSRFAGASARRRLMLAAGGVVLAALAVFAITRLTGADHLARIDAGALGVIDPKAVAITAQYRTGSDLGDVAAGAGSVWAANPAEGTVSRIHRDADRVETIDVGPDPAGLAFGGGSLWVAGAENGDVAQVDPAANRVVQRIRVGNGLRAVAVGAGAVWAVTALDGELVRIDMRSGRVTRRIAVGGQPVAVATGAGAVWAVAEESGTVARIDPSSGEIIAATSVGNGPTAVAVGLGAVWIANTQDGTISRIDPGTDRVTDTVPAGRDPVGLTIADHALWAADANGALLRLDPHTGAVTDTLRTGSAPAGLAAVGGAIWVAAIAPPAAHRGGTLRIGTSPVELDPAAVLGNADQAIVQLAYQSLVSYRRAGGAAGARLVGDLALDVPKPADGGRRYVFRLRRGLRYSNGAPVKAGDFRASLERFLVVSGGELPPVFDAIRGAYRCLKSHRACDLSRAITADEGARTVTIRLRRPDRNLLQWLKIVAVVPPGTPRRPLRADLPPGTGPYRIQRFVPRHRALLTRNPYFVPQGPGGRTAGFADRVAVTMGSETANTTAVERGRLDLVTLFESATAERLAALRTRFGTRLRSATSLFTEYAWLNGHARPFDDARVRRAVNLAVDRRREVALTGGPDAGSPTCQLLPPGMPGYRPTCAFTVAPSPAGAWTAPDLAEARRLVAASGTRGAVVDVWGWPPRRTVARYLANVLRELGFRSRVRIFPDLGTSDQAATDPRRHPQIGLDGWIADSPDPASFLRSLIGCGSEFNLSRFCDHGIDAAIDRAEAAGPDADAAWTRIERSIARRAPLVPLSTRRTVVVTSPRAGNIQFDPVYGVLLDKAWVR